MAHQEEGWPLGLQLLNVRVGRARDYFGSISFNTALTSSSSTSSTDSSSDLDTESTGSFFHDRNITLGSLMRASSIMDISRRSMREARRRRTTEPLKPKNKSRAWFFSLCSKDSTKVMNPENAPSLGHFLAVDRRPSMIAATNASNFHGRARNLDAYLVPDEISLAEHLNSVSTSSSLFLDGQIAPPRPRSRSAQLVEGSCIEGLDQGVPVLLPFVFCNAPK
ncbi:LOW QUALITY PROTEIN: hypothetical protein V2J09_017248 [Rumex salicifolius]